MLMVRPEGVICGGYIGLSVFYVDGGGDVMFVMLFEAVVMMVLLLFWFLWR